MRLQGKGREVITSKFKSQVPSLLKLKSGEMIETSIYIVKFVSNSAVDNKSGCYKTAHLFVQGPSVVELKSLK